MELTFLSDVQVGVDWYLPEALVSPRFCYQIFLSPPFPLWVLPSVYTLHLLDSWGLCFRIVFSRWVSTEDWKTERKREVRVIFSAFLSTSLWFWEWLYCPQPQWYFPLPCHVRPRESNVCWFPGPWSSVFGGSFNPAYTSMLGFLIRFHSVHFSVSHLLVARILTNTCNRVDKIYDKPISSSTFISMIPSFDHVITWEKNWIVLLDTFGVSDKIEAERANSRN